MCVGMGMAVILLINFEYVFHFNIIILFKVWLTGRENLNEIWI